MVALTALAVSCTKSDRLASAKLVKEFNKELNKNAISQKFYTIEVGEYECNDAAERETLRKFAAAGLITYDVTRYAWWEKGLKTVSESYQEPNYLWGYYMGSTTKYHKVKRTRYTFEDHYIVKISLTAKGKRYVVNELPVPEEDSDPDLVEIEINPESYAWNQVDLSEEWPEIENPFLPKKEVAEAPATEEEEEMEDEWEDASDLEEEPEKDTSDPDIERIEMSQYNGYLAFQEDKKEVYVKTFAVRAVKARNIREIEDADGKHANCEIILEVQDVSDFGRIIEGLEDGEREKFDCEFDYFVDKGWVLVDE